MSKSPSGRLGSYGGPVRVAASALSERSNEIDTDDLTLDLDVESDLVLSATAADGTESDASEITPLQHAPSELRALFNEHRDDDIDEFVSVPLPNSVEEDAFESTPSSHRCTRHRCTYCCRRSLLVTAAVVAILFSIAVAARWNSREHFTILSRTLSQADYIACSEPVVRSSCLLADPKLLDASLVYTVNVTEEQASMCDLSGSVSLFLGTVFVGIARRDMNLMGEILNGAHIVVRYDSEQPHLFGTILPTRVCVCSDLIHLKPIRLSLLDRVALQVLYHNEGGIPSLFFTSLCCAPVWSA